MGDDTRVISSAARERKFLAVWREKGYYVLYNRLTKAKRFYARAADVLRLLRPNDDAGRPA
jgi:hypothetical protein